MAFGAIDDCIAFFARRTTDTHDSISDCDGMTHSGLVIVLHIFSILSALASSGKPGT